MNLNILREQNIIRQSDLYSAQCNQFGLHVLQKEDNDTLFTALKKSGVWAVKNPTSVTTAIKTVSPFSVLIGFKPSRFHLGHLTLAHEINHLIRLGGIPIFVVAGYEAGLQLSQQEARRKVSEFWSILNNLQCSANNPFPDDIISDRDCMDLRLIEDRIAEILSISKLSSLYGWGDATSVATMRIPCMSAASFLLPQYMYNNRPTVILSDINQVTHAEVTKIASRALKLAPPMFSYRTLLPSLTDPDERMSVKKPKSVIFLDDSIKDITRKLKKCFSGGRSSIEEQQEKGGDPHRCSFFKIAKTILSEDRTVSMLNGCTSGQTLCGDCKGAFVPQIIETISTLKPNASV